MLKTYTYPVEYQRKDGSIHKMQKTVRRIVGKPRQRKWSDEEILEMKKLIAMGVIKKRICDDFDITRPTLIKIMKEETDKIDNE